MNVLLSICVTLLANVNRGNAAATEKALHSIHNVSKDLAKRDAERFIDGTNGAEGASLGTKRATGSSSPGRNRAESVFSPGSNKVEQIRQLRAALNIPENPFMGRRKKFSPGYVIHQNSREDTAIPVTRSFLNEIEQNRQLKAAWNIPDNPFLGRRKKFNFRKLRPGYVIYQTNQEDITIPKRDLRYFPNEVQQFRQLRSAWNNLPDNPFMGRRKKFDMNNHGKFDNRLLRPEYRFYRMNNPNPMLAKRARPVFRIKRHRYETPNPFWYEPTEYFDYSRSGVGSQIWNFEYPNQIPTRSFIRKRSSHRYEPPYNPFWYDPSEYFNYGKFGGFEDGNLVGNFEYPNNLEAEYSSQIEEEYPESTYRPISMPNKRLEETVFSIGHQNFRSIPYYPKLDSFVNKFKRKYRINY